MQDHIDTLTSWKQHSNKAAKCISRIYLALTVLIAAYVIFVYLYGGLDLLEKFIAGTLKKATLPFFYLIFLWIIIGHGIFLVKYQKIDRNNWLFWSGFFFCALIYTLFLSERTSYGDFGDYYRGAQNIVYEQPFHPRYIYLPFWATILQPLAHLGFGTVQAFCLGLNLASFLVFYTLTCKILTKFNFSKELAVVFTTVFLCINTPVIRTFGYIQVNFHMTNLILLSLLTYQRSKVLSAFFLALGFHLKISPAIFALPFLLNKDWRWLSYFFFAIFTIVIFTSLANDFSYYGSSIANLQKASNYIMGPSRQNSIDCFIKSTFVYTKAPAHIAKYLIIACKVTLIFFTAVILRKNITNRTFLAKPSQQSIIYNSFPALSLLMTAISPIIWPHHLVFLIPAFLIIFKKNALPYHMLMYIFAWILMFVIPTFNFYPLAFHRLLGLLICFWLLWQISKQQHSQKNVIIDVIEKRLAICFNI